MTKTPPSHEGPAGPAVVPALSPHGVDRMGHRRRRALWGAVGVVVVLALLLLGAGGWLWWTRPSTTSVPLPAGVGRGNVISLHGSIPAPETKAGRLETGGMRSERHQWIGSVRWTPKGGESTEYEMHLGESVHIDGLGTVTLLAVNPPPLIPEDKDGGWTTRVHVALDPGLHWCRKWDPC